jgi:hypothetical protein
MIYLTNDVNYQYFFYEKIPYRTGTVVKLKKSYTDTHTYNGEHIWDYAYFSHRVDPYGYSKYLFMPYCAPTNSGVHYSGLFRIDEKDMNNAIEEIIKPVYIDLVKKEKKKDIESSEVISGWAVLVIVLLFSFIFKEWYIIWFWSFVIFFIWRSKKLWE